MRASRGLRLRLIGAVTLSLLGASGSGLTARAATPLVYVANYRADSVTAYPAGASGNVRPVVTLAGPHTRIVHPAAIAHDPQGRLFVACQHTFFTTTTGEVLVFARGANGDAAPIRSFDVSYYPVNGGPGSGGYNAGPVYPTGLAVDWSGYTYVGLEDSDVNVGGSVVSVYAAAAHGFDPPLRVFDTGSPLAGPRVATNGNAGVYVVVPQDRFNPPAVGKFSNFATGNVPLGGPNQGPYDFAGTGGVAVAPRSGNVYGINYGGARSPSILVFDSTFTRLVGRIGGAATRLGSPSGIAVDGAGNAYVATADETLPNSLEIFAAGANGNVAPVRTIAGPNTGLNEPLSVTLVD